MRFQRRNRQTFLVFTLVLIGVMPSMAFAQNSDIAVSLTLGGMTVLRLSGTLGGADPQQRLDTITDRLTPILATPDLKPSDVVVYAPAHAYPSIYVLGRLLITVDKFSASSCKIGTPLQTAIVWAKKLQQILPLVDIRLPNEPEPTVPRNPPLLVTTNFGRVGGGIGDVYWNKHLVLSLTVSPVVGVTATQYCDEIGRRLDLLVGTAAPGAVSVTTAPSVVSPQSMDVLIDKVRLISTTKAEADSVGLSSQLVLAEIWCGNLQRALQAEQAADSP